MLVRVTKKSGPNLWYGVGEVYNVELWPGHDESWTVDSSHCLHKRDAELLPDWDDVDDKYRFRAVDRNGELWYYKTRPVEHDGVWTTGDGGHSFESDVPCPNWESTLEERPEEKSETFIAGLQLTTEGSGPYEHTLSFMSNRPVFPWIDTGLLDVYKMPSILEFMFGGTKQEEDDMGPNENCPRSKELTAAEQVGEKMGRLMDERDEFVKRINERFDRLDHISEAIKSIEADATCKDELTATLLRQADLV